MACVVGVETDAFDCRVPLSRLNPSFLIELPCFKEIPDL